MPRPIPQILMQLMRQVDDESSSLEDLSRLIEQDPVIAAHILAAANSAALHRGRRPTTIREAVQVLGVRMLRSITLCLVIQGSFEESRLPANIALDHFWHHALITAEIARRLAVECGHAEPDIAYVSGLLHDLGMLLMLSGLRERYARTLEAAQDESTLCLGELSEYGATHAEVGAWLADQWQFDTQISDSILFHHGALEQVIGLDLLSRIVWTAHELSNPANDDVPVALVLPESVGLMPGDIVTAALKHVTTLAEALGITPPAADEEPSALPRAKFAESTRQVQPLTTTLGIQALMRSLQLEIAAQAERGAVIHSLHEATRILWGSARVGVLLSDPAGATLQGQGLNLGKPVLERLSFNTENNLSLLVRTWRQAAIHASFDSEAAAQSLSDLQLSRALGSEGVMYIPIGTRPAIGVLMLGISSSHHRILRDQSQALLDYAALVGRILTATSQQPETTLAAPTRTREVREFVHEIGNPISIIKNYLHILDRQEGLPMGAGEQLGILKDEINRITRIIDAFAEGRAEGQRLTDLNDTLTALLDLYADPLFAAKGIGIVTALDARQPVAAAGADSVRQIVLNLLKNASEALLSGNQVQLRTSAVGIHDNRQYVCISIEDDGPGLPAAAAEQLYLAHTADELAEQGRGLGLGIVGNLTRALGGHISCESGAGQGTRFTLFLPALNADHLAAPHDVMES